ncbi:hypothetical protein [Sphingobacterium griseoflavum]|uniref:Lipoprotein n=1 Tax=Sphingobacterium griseoflavum TaxID=1474952 RepID=A0ABQ3HRD5_9SPHI|nr:hypothetical protein [Sphingobacterium griseoflavum]GHE23404.1 hypothetical protein GCM10017764_03720 [Sphingobacterium griseoflavum]
MKNWMYKLSFLWIGLFLVSCAKTDDDTAVSDSFVHNYGGKPFVGSAKGQRTVNGQVDYEWNGEGRVVLMDVTADSVSILFMADFDAEGEINFKVRGAYNATDFLADGDAPTQVFSVARERINGQVVNSAQSIVFSGNLQREKAAVHMRVEFLEGTSVFPVNSVLDLWFDTERNISEGSDTEGCALRLVPIWSPTGVTMGMVPDC